MAKYIGLDVHAASCTMVIVGDSGNKLARHVVETNAKLLVDLIKGVARPRYLCFEEGTQSAWLYEVLSPHTDETVVTIKRVRVSCENKDDDRDALDLAEKLRTNSVEVRVYKQLGNFGRLRELCRVHRMQVQDSVKVQNRVLALYRSRGTRTDRSVFGTKSRQDWIGKLPARMQTAAETLLRPYPLATSCAARRRRRW
jgi:hypothetical protein